MLTDFHSHILPEMDDGSRSLQESIAMLRSEWKQGIRHVIATPHFYARYDTPVAFLERRAASEWKLREEMQFHENLPDITVGAEVAFFRGISESEVLGSLTIGESSAVLIEMPAPPWPAELYRELLQIWERQRLIPVIAHVDRYIRPLRTFGIPRKLSQLPVYVQANASFFTDPGTAMLAMRMLKQEQIHLIGSDCHNMSSRKPNLGKAIAEIKDRLGNEAISGIVRNETAILNTL